jgi:tRNA pseudouridine55 synthase
MARWFPAGERGRGTLIEALDQFRGPIMQVPSMYSALKHNGRPLYEYAREGIEIEREARPITMFELKLISFEGDEVKLEVHCSKGTYIRSLVDDLGSAGLRRITQCVVPRWPATL